MVFNISGVRTAIKAAGPTEKLMPIRSRRMTENRGRRRPESYQRRSRGKPPAPAGAGKSAVNRAESRNI